MNIFERVKKYNLPWLMVAFGDGTKLLLATNYGFRRTPVEGAPFIKLSQPTKEQIKQATDEADLEAARAKLTSRERSLLGIKE